MKRFVSDFSIVCGVCFLAILVMTPNSSWAGKKYLLRYTGPYMGTHPTVINAFNPWAKKVKSLSRGRLIIKWFNPNTICPRIHEFDCVINGTLDIGGQFTGLNPGKFPLNEMLDLPFLVPSAEAGSMVVWHLNRLYPAWRNEFKKVKLLWQWTSATFQLHTTHKLVKTLADLKGLRIIGWSPTLRKIIRALGANPLEIHPTETYLALERGMADGVLSPLAPVRSFKINEAAKYTTIANISVGAFWMGMNRKEFKNLPKNLQNILVNSTGEKMARLCGKTLDQGARRDAIWMKKRGHIFYVLPPAELARWRKATNSIHEEWLKKMEAKGYRNVRVIYKKLLSFAKKYAATTGRGY